MAASAEAELDTDLAAWEEARRHGPEAVLALARTLRGAVLDAAMPDIVAAHRQIALAAPPRPATPPVSSAEEAAILEAQTAIEAASRIRALAFRGDPGENNAPPSHAPPPAPSAAPMADLTVGAGCTYATIGAAVAAAGPGDRLLIEGGVTFTENVTVPIDLNLEGGYDGCASGSTDRTTIDGNAGGTVVVVDRAIAVSLQNLNLTNGATGFEGGGIRFAWGGGTGALNLANVHVYGNTGQWGGGLWVGPDAEVTGDGVEIHDNTATAFGGGVRLYGGRATFSDSNIHGNSAPSGAGVYATHEDGIAPQLNLPSYADVYDNNALTGDGFGGGVYLREGTVWLADCSDIIGNNAIEGGGAYLLTSTLTIYGDCSEIMLNTATGNGGGVYALDSTVNLDDGAELYANWSQTGGGAYLDNSSLRGDKASIRHNTADLRGGGVHATNGSVLDMDLGGFPCIGPRCSRLSFNTATTYYGGGVYVGNSSVVDLRNTFVESNSADYCGGVYAYNDSTVRAYNSLLARNDAVGGTGDAIRLNLNVTMTGAGNTLAHNDAGGAATGQAIGMTSSSLSLHCSIIWGHGSSIDSAGQDVTYSDVQGGYAGVGNLDVDPLFVAPAGADFHLQPTSPVVDRCASFSGMNTDFDNEIRPIVIADPATPFDIGADEFSAPRVGVNGGGCAFGTLSQAVAAASAGDTIQVAAGDFFETVDIFDTSLTVTGGYGIDCTTPGAGVTVLDASYQTGSVVDVSSSTVTLRNLQITGGSGVGGGLDVQNSGNVTLDNTRVTGNTGAFGAGLYVSSSSVVTLTNGSRVDNNTATSGAGGGARVWGQLIVNDAACLIADNTAPSGGGVSVAGGVLDLGPGHVQDNQATGADGRGGGIHAATGAVVTLTGSSIHGNSAADGAGVYADGAAVHFLGPVIHSNTAADNGGGVYLTNGSTLHASGETMIGYAAAGWGGNRAATGAGGGLYVQDSEVQFSGAIHNNYAATRGGGVFADSSTITLSGADVGGAGADQPNQLGPSGNTGAGLYLSGGTEAAINDTVVAGNAFQTAGFTYGGGLYVTGSSEVTLTASRVENHLAPSATDGRGAGFYVNGSTVTLDNSQVVGNTAGTTGGGLRLWAESVLNVLNGSQIVDNHALYGQGGGIAAGGTPDVDVSDSTLRDNTAGTDGGAIFLDAGTLDFAGGWTLRQNDAGGNGGAVAVLGTAVASFRAGGYGFVYFNRALGGHGGMVFLGNTTTARLHATSGHEMYLYANHASENGGALYAGSGGLFDIYGQVSFDRNRAGNGGAMYLAGGSRVWLDDYVNIRPQLRGNRADSGSGGAVYAEDSPRVECDGATFGSAGEGNQAAVSGGALFLSGSVLDADNCVFQDNSAVGHGGAIAAETSTLTLFATYPAPSPGAQPAGSQPDPNAPGAPTASACDPLVEPCKTVSGAVAGSSRDLCSDGGAIAAHASTSPNPAICTVASSTTEGATGPEPTDTTVTRATACDPRVQSCSFFSGNIADGDANDTGDGGAVYTDDSTLSVTHTYFRHNSAARGGAIFQTGPDASAEVANSLIHGNTVSLPYGAGIHRADGEFSLTHVTLADNVGGSGFSGTANEAHNTIAWGNDGHPGFSATPLNASCNIDDGGHAGANEDPLFVDPGDNENYRLSSGSPAIDACLTGLSPDLDNLPRPRGIAYDMGAYEYAIFTVTPSAGANGVIVPDTPQTVEPGETVQFVVVPAPGYAAAVGGTCGGALVGNIYTTAPVTTDCTVEAVFAVITHTVTPSAGPNGSIAPDTPQTVTHGHTAQFTVTADPGHTAAVGGTCGGALVGNIYTTAPVTTDCTVEAVFAVDIHIITATSGPGGVIDPSGTVPVNHGGDVTFTMSPDTGNEIADVLVDGASLGALDTYTFTDVQSDHTIHAEFQLLRWPLTVTLAGAGGGTVSSDPPGIDCGADCIAEFDHGTEVTLSAEPDAASAFVGWSGAGCSGAGACVATMTEAREVTATFTDLALITLLADPPEGGSVSGEGEFQIGEPATVVATPNLGWAFVEWRQDGVQVSTNPRYTFTLTRDTELTAAFEESAAEAIPASGPVGILLLVALLAAAGVLMLRRG